MALKQSKLKQIPQRNKDLTFGFIREHEKCVKNTATIPTMIKYLSLVYLNVNKDKFDRNLSLCSDRIEINGQTAIWKVVAWNCYLENIATKGIHIWSFKCSESGNIDMLGVIKVIEGKELPQDEEYFDGDDGYGIIMGSYQGIGPTPDKWPHYITVKGRRDIIKMRLDMNNLTLSYTMNGMDLGKAYDIEMGKYRAAITGSNGSSWTLLSYQHIY